MLQSLWTTTAVSNKGKDPLALLEARLAAIEGENRKKQRRIDELEHRVQLLEHSIKAQHDARPVHQSSALPPLPSVPSTPGVKGNWNDRQLEESFSIYSHATTAASQPAAFFASQQLGAKLGAYQITHPSAHQHPLHMATSYHAQHDSQSVYDAQRNNQWEQEACMDGVLSAHMMQRVKETVSADVSTWITSLSLQLQSRELQDQPPLEEVDTPRASSAVDYQASHSSPDDTTRRASRDQEGHIFHTTGPLNTSQQPNLSSPFAAAAGKPKETAADLEAASSIDTIAPYTLSLVAIIAACHSSEQARLQICQAGLLPQVAYILKSGNAAARRLAAHVIWYTSRCPAAAASLTIEDGHDEGSIPLEDAEWSGDEKFRPSSDTNAQDRPDEADTTKSALCVIGSLLHVLKDATEDVYTLRACSLALNNLTEQSTALQSVAISLGAVEVLTGLLSQGTNYAFSQEAAAAALLSLTGQEDEEDEGRDNQRATSGQGVLDVSQASDDGRRRGYAVVQRVLRTPGALQAFASALRYGDPALQENMAGLMQNITMVARSQDLKILIRSGCVTALLETARSGTTTCQEAAIAALGNIASDASTHADLTSCGLIELLSYLISQPLPGLPLPGTALPASDQLHTFLPCLEIAAAAAQVQASSMLALRNLCAGNATTKKAVVEKSATSALLHVISSQQASTLAAGLEPLLAQQGGPAQLPTSLSDHLRSHSGGSGNFTQQQQQYQQRLQVEIATRISDRVVELEDHEAEMQCWALAGLLSLSTEPALRETLVHQVRAGPPLMAVLLGGAPQAKETAAKALTNLSIPDSCKAALMDQGAGLVLVPAMRGRHSALRQAACRAVQNLARLGSNRLQLAACGALPALLDAIPDPDQAVFEAAAAAMYGLCNHIQVLDELLSIGGPTVILTALRKQSHHDHFNSAINSSLGFSIGHASSSSGGGSSKGVKLLLRLLHRMSLTYCDALKDTAQELAALGMI